MKVLVAEDEPVLRCALESLLTGWGYQVVMTPDGCEACRLLCGTARGCRAWRSSTGSCPAWTGSGFAARSSATGPQAIRLPPVADRRGAGADIVEGLDAEAGPITLSSRSTRTNCEPRLKAASGSSTCKPN